MLYIEKSDTSSTLTTYAYCWMWMLWTAEKMGLEGYIHCPADRRRWLSAHWDDAKFAQVPNAFDWYFKQPKWSGTTPPPRDLTWEWEHCPETGRYPLASEPLSVIKAFYQKNLVLNDAVEARGQALLARHSLDPAQTIGITWRGTDIFRDGRPRIPIEVYFPFIDEILAAEPGLRIACTAEETGILDPLLARYPTAFVVSEFISAPNGATENPEKLPGAQATGFERGMQPALMVWLFSKCRHYIKNRSSSAAVASWLSKGRIVSIAHRENLDYTKLPDHAEIEGQLVPLRR